MMKLNLGLTKSFLASNPGSTATWGSERINPRPSPVCVWPGVGPLLNDDDYIIIYYLILQDKTILFKKKM